MTICVQCWCAKQYTTFFSLLSFIMEFFRSFYISFFPSSCFFSSSASFYIVILVLFEKMSREGKELAIKIIRNVQKKIFSCCVFFWNTAEKTNEINNLDKQRKTLSRQCCLLKKKGLINILHSAENSDAFSTNGIYLRKSVMLEVNVGFKEFLFSSSRFHSMLINNCE